MDKQLAYQRLAASAEVIAIDVDPLFPGVITMGTKGAMTSGRRLKDGSVEWDFATTTEEWNAAALEVASSRVSGRE